LALLQGLTVAVEEHQASSGGLLKEEGGQGPTR